MGLGLVKVSVDWIGFFSWFTVRLLFGFFNMFIHNVSRKAAARLSR